MTTNENSGSPKIFREERLKLITKHILADNRVYVNELAKQFNVSPSSIRTDLDELEAFGILKRTHGGAIISEALAMSVPITGSPDAIASIITDPADNVTTRSSDASTFGISRR